MKNKVLIISLSILTVIAIIFGVILLNKNNILAKEKIQIIDATITCPQSLEKFYEDNNYTYSFTCIKSSSVFVKFPNGNKMLVTDALNEGKVIGIFPEGTTNKTKDIILPFKIGAVKMASETNTKIIPFVITGKYKLFNNKLTIEFLQSIKIPKVNDLTEYNEKLMNIISEKLKEKRN